MNNTQQIDEATKELIQATQVVDVDFIDKYVVDAEAFKKAATKKEKLKELTRSVSGALAVQLITTIRLIVQRDFHESRRTLYMALTLAKDPAASLQDLGEFLETNLDQEMVEAIQQYVDKQALKKNQ